MILDEILLHNFAIYKGRQRIVLTPPSLEQPVTLFGGLNGGGKTTFVDALQLILYGKMARCSNRGTLSYEEFLRRSINESTDPREGAAIGLRFRQTSEGEEHTYQIQRSWYGTASSVRETVEVIKDGKYDRVLTETWNEQVELFIPVRLSNLFFFDAEKIEEFANVENSAQLLSTAVYSLLGLELVERLSTDLLVYERRKRTALKSQADRQRVDQLKTELDQLIQQREALVLKQGSTRNELDQRKRRLEELLAKFRIEGGELFERKAEFEAQRKESERRLRALEEELRQMATGVAPLLLVPGLLQSIIDQDHREAEADKSEKLGHLLASRDARILKELSSQRIPDRVLALLSSVFEKEQQSHVVTNVSPYLHLPQEARDDLKTVTVSTLPALQNRLTPLLQSVEAERVTLVDLDRKLASIPVADSLESLQKERHKLQLAVNEAQVRFETVTEELAHKRQEITQKESKLSAELEKNIEAELDQEDTSRMLFHSQKVRQKLEKFRSVFVESRIHQVGGFILDSFQQLLRKQSLISGLKINPEKFSLELYGQDGRVLSPERLSAGERQLLAISMLWGLGRASGRPLPTVIDTPLGRLDASHRTLLVERYFPFASHQVLLFSTDKEIDEAYFEKLKPYIGHFYRLEYEDAAKATQIRKGYFWEKVGQYAD